MAGLAETRGPEGDNFWTWREVMYRFLDRLGPEEVEAIAAQAYVEMLERGFTRVGEFHYLHHDPAGEPYANVAELAERVAAACSETGIGLTLFPVFYAQANFGGAPPAPGQRRFLNDTDSFAALWEASSARSRAGRCQYRRCAPQSACGRRRKSFCASWPSRRPAQFTFTPPSRQGSRRLRCWSGKRPVQWLLDEAVSTRAGASFMRRT